MKQKTFLKFIDNKGKELYKENGFDMEDNKLIKMNVKIKVVKDMGDKHE